MSILYHQLSAFTIGGLAFGAIYALMAFGYTIVYRILRLFNFAHGGTYMVATFVALGVDNALAVGTHASPVAVIGAAVAMFVAAAAAGQLLLPASGRAGP